ncbi:MAG: hypothetical protein R6V73_13690, partial [Anaerolineales bacterium]
DHLPRRPTAFAVGLEQHATLARGGQGFQRTLHPDLAVAVHDTVMGGQRLDRAELERFRL